MHPNPTSPSPRQLPPCPGQLHANRLQDYYTSLEESLQGGVTVVQVREKETDTGEFVEVARRTKEVCDKVSVECARACARACASECGRRG
jgi:thiamine monophosphate synthase